MLTNFQKLTKLPVVTQSGTKLGHVFDVNFDVESHQITDYLVRENFLSSTSYIIKPSQVRSITSKEIVVDDGVIKVVSATKKKAGSPVVNMVGGAVSMTEEN